MSDSLAEQPDDLQQVETLTELLRIGGKDEMNLAEFPMTSLSDKPITGEISLKFEDQIYDDRKKKLITRKRIIEGSKEYGLPTATDDSVILALIQLTKLKNGFTNREVPFSRYELIQMLAWPNKGQSYDRMAQSLHRLASVTYHFENSWWDNRRKAWTTKIFGIIDNVDLNDSRENDGQGGLFTSRIFWNQTVLDSFQAGYLRSLDFQLAMSFKHAISMRIYRFMGKRFHLKPEWTFDLKDFSYEHIGLSRNYEGGTQIARKLKPAITELEKAGFLEPLPESKRFGKKGRDWTIRLVENPTPLVPAPDASIASLAEPHPLMLELANRGVSIGTAAELVQRHEAEAIAGKIEVFDWMSAKQDKRLAKSPAGYLVSSINKDYATPKGFLSKAEQERQAETKRQAEQAANAERHRKQELDCAERRLADQVKRYRQTRTPDQLTQLEAEAIAQASEKTRLGLDQPHMQQFRRTQIALLINEHIARLIESGQLTVELA